ncbi:hypothetical protein SRHO_G00105370 [Serrasalmus rhombeus]
MSSEKGNTGWDSGYSTVISAAEQGRSHALTPHFPHGAFTAHFQHRRPLSSITWRVWSEYGGVSFMLRAAVSLHSASAMNLNLIPKQSSSITSILPSPRCTRHRRRRELFIYFRQEMPELTRERIDPQERTREGRSICRSEPGEGQPG